MRVLGALLAGGAARRFGSDKALAMWRGRRLIDHAHDALVRECDAVVVCGRAGGVADRPAAGLGPLGGLAAALHHAHAHRFDLVLSAPCDVPDLPAGLRALLDDAPAYVAGLPVVGLWPARLSAALDAHLAETDDRSMRGWIARCGARAVALDAPVRNVNTPADLVP